MPLQFYLGRAGSGKTHRCIEEITQRLRENPSPAAPALIYLLPEQATAQTEGRLIARADLRGFARAHILSFKRLAQLILRETGGAPRDFLDEQGRLMLLRALVARHRDELQVFAQSARESGFIARLANTFSEIAHYRHTFDELNLRREELENQGQGQSLLARKLHDLELLGRAWERQLGDSFDNPDHFLDELSQRLEKSSLFDAAEVWIDGFASFMPQEIRVLESILRKAKNVRLTLLLEPHDLSALPSSANDANPTRLFSQSEETYLKIKALALDLDLETKDPLLLPTPDAHPTRFSDTPALATLEENLARSAMLIASDTHPENDAPPEAEILEGLPEDAPPLLLVEAASRREEVEGLARSIRRLVRAENYRYRDIAVTLRNLEPYHALIRSAFDRHDIPYFLDHRRGVAHHPLVEILRSSLRVPLSRWSHDDIVHYLKTDFAPLQRHEADQLENLALKNAWQGRRWRTAPVPPDLQEIRQRAFAPLLTLQRALSGDQPETTDLSAAPPMEAARFVRALLNFLNELQCDKKMDLWTQRAREQGNLDQADENEQAWDGILKLLAEMQRALAQETMPPSEFAEVLETGLEGLTLGLVPPSLDQVLVGTVERSRHPDIRALFVLGMNDHIFPNIASEDVILSDTERETLSETGAMELSPTSTIRLFRERYLGYVALTRPSQRLWVSYAAADSKGKALAPSPFIPILLKAAAPCSPPLLQARLDADWLEGNIQAVERIDQAIEGVVRSRREQAPDAPPETASAWNRLGERLDETPETNARLTAAAASLSARNETHLDPTEPQSDTLSTTSVTRLETYAACPFQYYAHYMLSLKEREEFQIGALDIGNLHHQILSEVYAILSKRFAPQIDSDTPENLSKRPLDWGAIPIQEANEALREAMEEHTDQFLSDGPMGQSQSKFFLDRSASLLQETLKSFILQGADDEFLQAGAECAFGFSGCKTPPLKIIPAEGPPILLHGIIDRVDIAPLGSGGAWAARIIDFKSSERKLNLSDAHEGLSLQLLLYMAALNASAPQTIHPAGAFFLPIMKKTLPAKAPPEALAPKPEPAPLKARGILDQDSLDLFGPPDPKGSLPHVAVRLKKTGEPGWPDSGDWVPPGALAKLLADSIEVASHWSTRIRSRAIDVHPYRRQNGSTPCAYCPYKDLCRVDPHTTKFREIQPLKKSEILQ